MPDGAAEAAYLAHRPLVVRLAYDITGSWADAEDVASQVYLAWISAAGRVTNPRAYLARMATNRALDVVTERERVGYVGPWLPEPVLTAASADEAMVVADEVEIALMVVLGSLSPLERAAFLLHDIFSFSHDEVADILGRDPAAVRKLASRARAHLAERRRPRDVPDAELAALVSSFLAASREGDLEALQAHLTDDAVFVGDGGGRVTTALRPVVGAEKVARLFAGLAKNVDERVAFEPIVANRRLGLAVWFGDVLDQVLWLLLDGDRISQILCVRNPDKLAALSERLRSTAQR